MIEHPKQFDKQIVVRVSSGGSVMKVEAFSFIEAFEKFLNKKAPKSLGVLVEFKTKHYKPDEDTWYMLSQTLLEKLGRWNDAH